MLVAQITQASDHALHPVLLMAQHVTMLLVLHPPLRARLAVGGIDARLQLRGGVEEVHQLRAPLNLRRQLTQKAPVVPRPIGQLHHPQIGPLLQCWIPH